MGADIFSVYKKFSGSSRIVSVTLYKSAHQQVSACFSCFLFLLFLAVDEFLECSAGLEDRKLRGGNLDCLTRLRVAALASGALRNLEGAELEERYRIVLLQCFADCCECSREYRISLFLRRASLLSDGFDEICFLQKNPLFRLLRVFSRFKGIITQKKAM